MINEVPTALERERRQRNDISVRNADMHRIMYDGRCIRYPTGV